MKNEGTHELHEKLNAFKKAALELSEAWEKSTDDASRALERNYPFEHDFEEVLLQIQSWGHDE